MSEAKLVRNERKSEFCSYIIQFIWVHFKPLCTTSTVWLQFSQNGENSSSFVKRGSSFWSSSRPKPQMISHIQRSKVDEKLSPLLSHKPSASRCIFQRRVSTSKVLAEWCADESTRRISLLAGSQLSLSHFVLLKWNDWVLDMWCCFKGYQPHIITSDISRWQQQPQSWRCTEVQSLLATWTDETK